MPADKHLKVNVVPKKIKVSSLNPGKSLLDFPYKSPTAINRSQHHTAQPAIHPEYFSGKVKKRATNTIGIIVHSLKSEFIQSALAGMEEVADRMGYEIMIMHSQENVQKEVTNAQMLFDQQVDGLIASLSLGTTNLDHFNIFNKKAIPVVFFDRVDVNGSNRSVVIDNIGTGYAATHHLIQQGCKRIAIVTSSLERNVYADRFSGFRNALIDHDLPFTDQLLIVKDLTEEAGAEAARQIIAMTHRPDGLFVTSDFVAAACMRTLMEYGLQVPDDIAIVGFNNDPIGKLTVPTLTTVNYPGLEMGRVATLQLINILTGRDGHSQTNTAIVPAGLIVRHSSLKKIHSS